MLQRIQNREICYQEYKIGELRWAWSGGVGWNGQDMGQWG